MCGDFNILVDTASNDSVKFVSLDTYNITGYVHTPTHLHGHVLDRVLTPIEHSVVSNVWVGGFISDHVLMHGQLEFIQSFCT